MRLKTIIILFSMLLPVASLRAGLGFSLTPPTQSGLLNNETFITGSLTNTSLDTNLFLNSVQITITNIPTNYLAADTNAFFANVPGILLPGETYRDTVCGVIVSNSAHATNFSGAIAILGGGDLFATNILATQTFQAVVPPAAVDIARSGDNFSISWPSPPTGFVLQQSSNLITMNWTAVTNTPILTNGLNQVVLPRSTNSQFYRLQYF